MIDVRSLLGRADVLFMTLDTLRYDVARDALGRGRTPNLAAVLPKEGWEHRHSPGNFTFAAHQAFFAGFLPTPVEPSKTPRPLAIRFPGSASIGERTAVFDTPNLVAGFAERGYRTVCIGGVGFFNPGTPLGGVLPGLFQERHWSPRLGVGHPHSTEHQVALACEVLARTEPRVFLFINVSAIHHPNRHHLPGADVDSLASHAAALEYVDRQLPPLFEALRRRGPAFCIVCSDHGTAYGEDGLWGHRVCHPVVWSVPYAEFLLEGA
jgi:Sulfatase